MESIDVFTTEEQGRLVHVVSTAPQLDILLRRAATRGERHDVVKLEEAAFSTAPI
jgi:hypothetical protein